MIGVTPAAAQRQLITSCSLILNTATDLPASDVYLCNDITISFYVSGVQRLNFFFKKPLPQNQMVENMHHVLIKGGME